MASQHDRDRTYEPHVSTFELTRAQEASYPLPINLMSKDFDYTIHEVSHNSKVEDLSNERSGSVETSEDISIEGSDVVLHVFSSIGNAIRQRR